MLEKRKRSSHGPTPEDFQEKALEESLSTINLSWNEEENHLCLIRLFDTHIRREDNQHIHFVIPKQRSK